jgi:hypothetical protein
MNRRDFLRASTAAGLWATVPVELFAQAPQAPPPAGAAWDPGRVRHLLPTVSDTRMLRRKRAFESAGLERG